MKSAVRTAVVAWLITVVYYFYQYMLRSAPAVMMPQLSEAFALTTSGVASAMTAAFIAQAMDGSPQVIENAAESALEHHLGMTCDPVAGFVQIPCIERCAYGAVKAWTGYMIANNESPANRRVDFDSTVTAMAITAKDMNPKYKETSEGGLALSVTLC